MKILVAGSGGGKGVAVDRKTGKRTYIRMGEIQAGLGIGVKKFQVVRSEWRGVRPVSEAIWIVPLP